jgi:23S rRNA G2069 N7-methylase RlmK/C1962 C5-methylase RlmI
MEPGTTIKDRLGDTVVFRSYNIALLVQIRDTLKALLEIFETAEVQFEPINEDYEKAQEEIGTTD